MAGTKDEELRKLVSEALEPLGFEVLEVRLQGAGKNRVLRVRLDNADETPITMGQLEHASRVLSLELDRVDPIAGSYRLEVESPGPDRPLFTRRHFERFKGLLAKVDTGERRFTGRIAEVGERSVVFRLPRGEEEELELGTFEAKLAEWPKEPR